jgi:dTDP-L-rhamnose 4-epimerase
VNDTALITGGAGFIGSYVGRRLLACGWRVRALDSLSSQVHGDYVRPDYLPDEVELVVGDIRDRGTLDRALRGVDAVIHLAARVGVGQSMYEMADYTSVNTHGTGVLLEGLAAHPPRKLVVASSMSIYGEGLYRDADGAVLESVVRDRSALERGEWEPRDRDGRALEPLPTPEWKHPHVSSIYAMGKLDQERMCLLFGSSYGVPTVALRFFNVFGPDQALSNPYTGVLAIFASRLLNGRPPVVFEDGEQRRDFVSVHDVAQACCLALERPQADGRALNIGSGRDTSVREVAHALAQTMGRDDIEPEMTHKHRVGDIRHCFADITLARDLLGYEPRVEFEQGLLELAQWLEGQVARDDVEAATAELASRGLTL